jgi:hypothetical protein
MLKRLFVASTHSEGAIVLTRDRENRLRFARQNGAPKGAVACQSEAFHHHHRERRQHRRDQCQDRDRRAGRQLSAQRSRITSCGGTLTRSRASRICSRICSAGLAVPSRRAGMHWRPSSRSAARAWFEATAHPARQRKPAGRLERLRPCPLRQGRIAAHLRHKERRLHL